MDMKNSFTASAEFHFEIQPMLYQPMLNNLYYHFPSNNIYKN